jgi:hypothetical protein
MPGAMPTAASRCLSCIEGPILMEKSGGRPFHGRRSLSAAFVSGEFDTVGALHAAGARCHRPTARGVDGSRRRLET